MSRGPLGSEEFLKVAQLATGPVFRRLRQEDHAFEVVCGYIARPCLKITNPQIRMKIR